MISILQQAVDHFWDRLDVQETQGRFGILSRPAVHVSLLVLLAFAFCLGGLSPNKILEGDEALYALVPKTILLTGDWIHLTYNGEPYFFKPPLNFWITAAFFRVLPMNALTASLGSALFGALSALLIFFMCRLMFPEWTWGFVAALVFLTTHEVLHWTRGVHLETVLNFWTLTALLCTYLSVRHPIAIVGMGAAAALGWLAKGPQSLYPGAVALIIWWSEGILWRRLFSVWSIGAGLILIALLAPWMLLRLQERSGFGEQYFMKELGRTLFGPTQSHNGFFYYFFVLPATYWPWLPAALLGFFILIRGRRRSLGARVWLVYTAVVVVILLLTAEKRARYLFQLYPALSVAAGAALVLATEYYPKVLHALVVLTVIAAVGLSVFGRKNIAGAPGTRDAVEAAKRLDASDHVWLTDRVAQGDKGDPSIAKSFGFYAAPLLSVCASLCATEATPGALVIARADEADEVARLMGGRIDYSNKTVAIVRKPETTEAGSAR